MFNDQHPTAPALLTTQQAADRLGLTTSALHGLRCTDDGLPIVQKGFVVGYRLEDIRAFEQREVLAMLEQVLAAERPLPLIRAIAKAVMSPPITDGSSPQPLPITPSAPDQAIASPSNIHRLPTVNVETTQPTEPLINDSSDTEPTPLAPPMPAPSSTTPTQHPYALSWYLIHTKPRQEALAMTNLSRQGFECYMPMLKLQKIRQRKTALVAEPMFPRYLFIRLDTSGSGQSWSPIRSTLGVNQLVRFGGQPARVDGQLIDLIRTREQGSHTQPLFSAGEIVTVADGPFAGLEAIYQTTDAESRSMILLNILSKPVPLCLNTASLRRTG